MLTTSPTTSPTQQATHPNRACWLDTDGNPIQAHGGGMLVHEGFYYWYGEDRSGVVRQISVDRKRREAVGVRCYRSRDRIAWEDMGVVLGASDDPSHDLHSSKVIERPKVVFNRSTGQFVLWLHVDSPDYKAARAGVAVADEPTGPFYYVGSYRPNNLESRDQTIFQDDDDAVFHVCATDMNQNTLISRLSDNYLKPVGEYVKVFPKRSMEAFALCKRDGKYWFLASGCTGWKPNEARSAVSDNLMHGWEELGNPCVGPNAQLTFGGQSAFISPPMHGGQPHVAMFDLWRPDDLRTSGYIWLPIGWKDDRMRIAWCEVWDGGRDTTD